MRAERIIGFALLGLGAWLAFAPAPLELDGLAKAKGKRARDFDPGALAEGTRIEMEHTRDPRVARRIAMDHLTEDPAYYRKLAAIEAGR